MKPRTSRATNSSRSVRARAMPRNPAPWSISTRMYEVLGLPRPASRPQTGLVRTVTSEVMPTIQPVQWSVATSSTVLSARMWKGKLTKTNDHAKLPRNIASGII